MLPAVKSTDEKPPVGARGTGFALKIAAVVAVAPLTKTTGVSRSLTINVAVLRGVGVVVRVGVRVIVGVLDAVGLGVDVLAGGGLGIRFRTEQACSRSTVVKRMSDFRIATLQL